MPRRGLASEGEKATKDGAVRGRSKPFPNAAWVGAARTVNICIHVAVKHGVSLLWTHPGIVSRVYQHYTESVPHTRGLLWWLFVVCATTRSGGRDALTRHL